MKELAMNMAPNNRVMSRYALMSRTAVSFASGSVPPPKNPAPETQEAAVFTPVPTTALPSKPTPEELATARDARTESRLQKVFSGAGLTAVVSLLGGLASLFGTLTPSSQTNLVSEGYSLSKALRVETEYQPVGPSLDEQFRLRHDNEVAQNLRDWWVALPEIMPKANHPELKNIQEKVLLLQGVHESPDGIVRYWHPIYVHMPTALKDTPDYLLQQADVNKMNDIWLKASRDLQKLDVRTLNENPTAEKDILKTLNRELLGLKNQPAEVLEMYNKAVDSYYDGLTASQRMSLLCKILLGTFGASIPVTLGAGTWLDKINARRKQ